MNVKNFSIQVEQQTPGLNVPTVSPVAIGGDSAGQPPLPVPRIHYFDWLRVIAVLGVIIYHTLMPFARNNWLISNTEWSMLVLVIVSLFEIFGLAVLFLIAGGSARFALQRRSMRLFLAERAKRLLVPFVVGAIVLVPPTYYIVGLHYGTWSGSFLAFLMAYPGITWKNIISTVGPSPEFLTNIGMHLWFLAWLFICSILGWPIFAFLTSSTGKSWVKALGRFAQWRGAMLLLAIIVTLPRLAFSGIPASGFGWSLAAFVWYAVVFIVGYILYCDDRVVASIRRDLWLSLIVAVLGSVALTSFAMWARMPAPYSASYFIMWSLAGITGWAWTLTVLGFGMRVKFMQRPLPARLGEAALPAYILHFPIIVAVATLVIRSPLSLGVKILLSTLLGVGGSLLVAAVALKLPILRPLLGLRRPSPSVVQPEFGTR